MYINMYIYNTYLFPYIYITIYRMGVTPGFPASQAASAQRSMLRPRSAVAQAAFYTPDGDRGRGGQCYLVAHPKRFLWVISQNCWDE